jgi:hypothetical protein
MALRLLTNRPSVRVPELNSCLAAHWPNRIVLARRLSTYWCSTIFHPRAGRRAVNRSRTEGMQTKLQQRFLYTVIGILTLVSLCRVARASALTCGNSVSLQKCMGIQREKRMPALLLDRRSSIRFAFGCLVPVPPYGVGARSARSERLPACVYAHILPGSCLPVLESGHLSQSE